MSSSEDEPLEAAAPFERRDTELNMNETKCLYYSPTNAIESRREPNDSFARSIGFEDGAAAAQAAAVDSPAR